MSQKEHVFRKAEQRFVQWIMNLARSDYEWLGHILLRGLRFAWYYPPVPVESSSKELSAYPTGPYAVKRRSQRGDLLLWVPRLIDSLIIDDLTGRFGYSHITVDSGEVDLPTGKPVMVEVTRGQVVERKFQDEYADRPYTRIPLLKTGIDAEAFVACILSRLGEAYDTLEALSLGKINDPAKQMCSGLASECLPETARQKIVKARRLGLLRRSSVSVYTPASAPKTKVFISPNGFAQYFGAPKGQKLQEPDSRVEPHLVDISVEGLAHKQGWKAIFILAAAGVLAVGTWLILIRYRPS